VTINVVFSTSGQNHSKSAHFIHHEIHQGLIQSSFSKGFCKVAGKQIAGWWFGT